MPTETFIKESGSTEKPMAWAYSWTQMGQCMRASGKMISNTASAQNRGITTKSSLPATSSKARRPERAGSSSKEAITKEISSMVNSMASESTTSPTPVASMRVNLRTTTWRAKAK